MNSKTLHKLVKNIPNDMELGKKVRTIAWKEISEQIVKDENQPYIYERNPDTGEIFRRKFHNTGQPQCA